MNRIAFLLIVFLFACTDIKKEVEVVEDWPAFQGNEGRNQYSGLDQIHTGNVDQLTLAWEYHTGDSGQMQCNPIIIDGVLYGMSAAVQPFALKADSGEEIWRISPDSSDNFLSTSRGLVYWEDGADKRILYSHESWLIARDASTGKLIDSFGDHGKVSLKAGLGLAAQDKFVISNTPGAVFEELIIMPLRVSEGPDAAPGYIQAFNIRTGEVAWVFHTIPHPGEEGYDTWPPEVYQNNVGVGAANNWAGMAVDEKRGLLFVPTGSAAFDFYGGNRPGANLFANTLLALDARTGEKKWHYQLVHHDILDRDPPAAPNLLTVMREGQPVDAVAQVTKQGYVFLFDRENGQPLFDIEEVEVPLSDIPGEEAWPTQPRPVLPAPFARQALTEKDISEFAPNRDELIDLLRNSRNEGPFTPLSQQGSIVFPGLDGGAEWGGAATDPDGIIYINSNEMAWRIQLIKNTWEDTDAISLGKQVYVTQCSACHGISRKGNIASGFPSLENIKKQLTTEEVTTIIRGGKAMMPAFPQLNDDDFTALLGYLYDEETYKEPGLDFDEEVQAAYRISGYSRFLDSAGYPAISPPWGTLNAIDLNTGEYKWKIPYGEHTDLVAQGITGTGAENYGGPIITRGGLLFIAGTKDGKFRAYNKENGELLWETDLPAAGFATPSTYMVNEKQYIVIACGGTKLGARKGDSYVAFALP